MVAYIFRNMGEWSLHPHFYFYWITATIISVVNGTPWTCYPEAEAELSILQGKTNCLPCRHETEDIEWVVNLLDTNDQGFSARFPQMTLDFPGGLNGGPGFDFQGYQTQQFRKISNNMRCTTDPDIKWQLMLTGQLSQDSVPYHSAEEFARPVRVTFEGRRPCNYDQQNLTLKTPFGGLAPGIAQICSSV
jgi:hypothetical protein